MEGIDLIFAEIRKEADLEKEILGQPKTMIGAEKGAEEKRINSQKNIDFCNTKFERKYFFDNLFSILFPYSIFPALEEEEMYVLGENKRYNLIFITKHIIQENEIDIEKIKLHYKEQMVKSKQKTIFDITECKKVRGIEVFYFSAIHPMPEENLFQFIIIFSVGKQSVILNMSGGIGYYKIEKDMLAAMIQSIRIKKEEK